MGRCRLHALSQPPKSHGDRVHSETRGRHEFKIAAIDKTIAYPVETELYLGDPRVLLGLGMFSFAALLDLVLIRKSAIA